MGKYYIQNLIKGMASGINKNRLSDDYKQKATEITNAYISPSNTLIKRPPLREAGYEGLSGPNKGLVDVRETRDSLVALRQLDVADILPLDESGRVQSSVLEDGSAEEAISDFLGVNHHSLFSAIPYYIYDNPGCPAPKFAAVETYDPVTRQRKDRECRAYMTWAPNGSEVTEFNNRASRNFRTVQTVNTVEIPAYFIGNKVCRRVSDMGRDGAEAYTNITIADPISGQSDAGTYNQNQRIFLENFTDAFNVEDQDDTTAADAFARALNENQTAELYMGFESPEPKLNGKYVRAVSYTHLTLPTTPYV